MNPIRKHMGTRRFEHRFYAEIVPDIATRTTRFPYQTMSGSFNSNTAGVTFQSGTANRSTSVHSRFLLGFVLLDL
jgi:hypothetical protein